jgi:hypothetical protein
MKKLILAIFIFFLTTSICVAGQGMIPGMGIKGYSTAANMCDSTTDSSLLCEDFMSTTACYTGGEENCRVTWTRTVSGTSTAAFNNSSSGTACFTTSNKDLAISRGDANVIVYKAITDSSTAYLLFYFKPTSGTNSSSVSAFGLYDSSTALAYINFIQDGSGNMSIKGVHRNSSNSLIQHTAFPVTAGTWYKVEIKWIANQAVSGGFSIAINGTDKTGVDTTSINTNADNVRASITAAFAFEIGAVKVHTSAPACN